jgi:hypothetical protein
LNPLQNREKNRGQKKKTTTTKRGAQKRLQNFLFFLSFPYLSTRSMYGNGDKYLSDHVPHLLFACSLFRQLSTFLFFPDCQRRSVFVDPKDIQRSPEEESAVNYNNSCQKKQNCCEEIWCKSGVQRVRGRTSSEITSLFVSWKRAGQAIVPG